MGEERDKSSKRGGGKKREDQEGRGMTKVTKVVKMVTKNKNKYVDPGKMKINCTNTTQ